MGKEPFDVLVVGAGPGGSVAATVLARAGARVALLDKAEFPRDKACGDLIGPRGVQLLADLKISIPPGQVVGDMLVVGPTGRRVRLPSFEGVRYPGHAHVMTRARFDSILYEEAQRCGAVTFVGRADEPIFDDRLLAGFRTSSNDVVRADCIVGADGATSRVAAVSEMVDPVRVLWGFAVRTYIQQSVDLPTIAMWERTSWQALPGYGWVFPSEAGMANVGLGIGTLSSRTGAALAARLLPEFLTHMRALGLLDHPRPEAQGRVLGGWLKMGMIGTRPAHRNVLLVGDAAGLVNPLQGEGIAQAVTSGRAAADAVIAGPGQAAYAYTRVLAQAHLPYHRITAALQSHLLGRPRALAALGRLLTSAVGRPLSGGWAVFWNELLDGAAPGSASRVAALATALGRVGTSRTDAALWFDRVYDHSDEDLGTALTAPKAGRASV